MGGNYAEFDVVFVTRDAIELVSADIVDADMDRVGVEVLASECRDPCEADQ
jgi:hypothetical protein